MNEIIIAVLGSLAILVPAFLKYKTETRALRVQLKKAQEEIQEQNIKLTVLDKVLEISAINKIKDSVDRIFEGTRADRFLILIAVNGKTDFNVVSVIFEQHKGNAYKVNAIARYRNVIIDAEYKAMLKTAEAVGAVMLSTASMAQGHLRDFYELEGVKHSLVRHIAREPVDLNNDVLIYSSLATHNAEPYTRRGHAIIKTEYEGTIAPILKKVLCPGSPQK